jgi:hypothetical protein
MNTSTDDRLAEVLEHPFSNLEIGTYSKRPRRAMFEIDTNGATDGPLKPQTALQRLSARRADQNQLVDVEFGPYTPRVA